jgi:antitoxin CptB
MRCIHSSMLNRAQVEWRCRRGTKELDLLMQTWLWREFDNSTEADQRAFLELLEWPDDKLIRLLLGHGLADNTKLNNLAGKIRSVSLSRP